MKLDEKKCIARTVMSVNATCKCEICRKRTKYIVIYSFLYITDWMKQQRDEMYCPNCSSKKNLNYPLMKDKN